MKTKTTELVFILDRSGSMSGLEEDTICGFNSMLKKQKKEEGGARVTTVLFDHRYNLIHDRFDIRGVRPITGKEYFVEGRTALLDAMGRTISRIAGIRRNGGEEDLGDKVVFVIITDGMENASTEFTYGDIRKMVKKEKKKHGWEFLFLGANIDAPATAQRYGIGADMAANFHSDGPGTRLNYEVVGQALSDVRTSLPLTAAWKKEIDEDFEKRRRQ